ncbi:MAG: hypothetical protein V4689_04865 [Verrucomicrobiota bacterium]
MTAVLSPLPSPAPGLAARIVKSPEWKPIPSSFSGAISPAPTPLTALPSWSGESTPVSREFPTSWPAPLTVLPSPAATAAPVSPIPSGIPSPVPVFSPPEKSIPAATLEEKDFTDDDLKEAFGPIVEQAVRSAVYAKENGIDTYLEPMLRATIRRALAEYSPASRPFRGPGAFDRLFWLLQALFTSRTYEEILFEKTHRFQVEEVFLLDVASLALISFASCDPARHSSAKRVNSTVHRLAMQLRDEDEKVRETFELPDQRNVISRAGRFVILMAVVRGQPNELVLADLEFSLRRIEDRFREQFQDQGSALLHALQPFLEDCLLIQAPASAA